MRELHTSPEKSRFTAKKTRKTAISQVAPHLKRKARHMESSGRPAKRAMQGGDVAYIAAKIIIIP